MKENTQSEEKTMVGTHVVKIGPWNAIIYREMSHKQKQELLMYLEEEALCHEDNCPWWRDWHQCNCGAFDAPAGSK